MPGRHQPRRELVQLAFGTAADVGPPVGVSQQDADGGTPSSGRLVQGDGPTPYFDVPGPGQVAAAGALRRR